MNRVEKLLEGCCVESTPGLEFGPLANPLVKKKQGPIFYVDYADSETLREKSRNDPNVDREAIVEVDFSLADGPLTTLCRHQGPFGYALASHVFEHLPNPLGWLRDVADLLDPGGLVSLAIPDRRYTFDFFRSETTVAQLVAYDLEQLSRPSLVQLADHFYNVRQVDTAAAWEKPPSSAETARHHEDTQVEWILNQAGEGAYQDCHCTVWTSDQFLDTLPMAMRLRRLPLELARIHPPEQYSNEFIVQLRRIPGGKTAESS